MSSLALKYLRSKIQGKIKKDPTSGKQAATTKINEQICLRKMEAQLRLVKCTYEEQARPPVLIATLALDEMQPEWGGGGGVCGGGDRVGGTEPGGRLGRRWLQILAPHPQKTCVPCVLALHNSTSSSPSPPLPPQSQINTAELCCKPTTYAPGRREDSPRVISPVDDSAFALILDPTCRVATEPQMEDLGHLTHILGSSAPQST